MGGNDPTNAQSIIPATDSTNTQITTNQNQINITGGKLSSDGANLFHIFQQFGLDENQIANFISQPHIRNILTGINGGNPSIINGLITVTGGNSNLFFINPAGIVFGANAALNVPGDFTATTATSIGFDNGWFDPNGTNDYHTLIGQPSTFNFAIPQPGSIINAADLSVPPGHNLNLIGGTIINSGSLTATGGNITITAFSSDSPLVKGGEGGSTIRISQPGHILSLDIPASNVPITPLTLPQLLGNIHIPHANTVTVTPTGEVILSGSGWSVRPGDAALVESSLIADNATVSASNNITLVGSQLAVNQDLHILAGDTVRVRDGIFPLLATAGGEIWIQGDKNIDILALETISPFSALSDITLASNGQISGDAHFKTGGNFSIENLTGQPGTFISWYDPIIIAAGDILFGDYTGVALKVEAGGSITAGNITITGPDVTLANAADPDAGVLSSSAALILRSGVTSFSSSPNLPPNINFNNTSFTTTPISGNGISTGAISTAGGPVIWNSAGDIAVDRIETNGGNIDITAANHITIVRFLNSSGGDIDITSNLLQVRGSFINHNGIDASISSSYDGGGGRITIRHEGSINTPFIVGDATTLGTTGAITSGGETINPQFVVPVPPDTYNQGNITIITPAPETSPGSSEEGPALPDKPLEDPNETDSGDDTGSEVPGEETNGETDSGDDTDSEVPGEETGGETDPGDTGSEVPGEETGGETDPGDTGSEVPGGDTNSETDPGDDNTGTINAPGVGGSTLGTPTLTPDATENDSAELGVDMADSDGMLPEGSTVDADITDGELTIPQAEAGGGENAENLSIGMAELSEMAREELLEFIQENPGSSADVNNIVNQILSGSIANGMVIDNVIPGDGLVSPSTIAAINDIVTADIAGISESVTADIAGISESVTADIAGISEGVTAEPVTVRSVSRSDVAGAIDSGNLSEATAALDIMFSEELGDYIQKPVIINRKSFRDIQRTVGGISNLTRSKTAIIYLFGRPEQLDIIMVPVNGEPIYRRVPQAAGSLLLATHHRFSDEITNPTRRYRHTYLADARQLYDWIIAPIASELETRGIDTLLFSMDVGLRSLPIAALHDGQQFLVEKYRLALIPSINLTDTSYSSLKDAEVLAMGASQFPDNRSLPGVALEIASITKAWEGVSFLNENFTLENLKEQRQARGFRVIHLATHAEFVPGEPKNSYIQLADQKLTLDRLSELRWNDPPVDLLVLSACRTAVGDDRAELGFAGLAVQAEVKTALATLWYVSDEGTLTLMTEFYHILKQVPIKAEALRQAQIAMIHNQTRIQNGQLILENINKTIPLPPELANQPRPNLQHPYYWAPFTMIGSPW